MSERSGAASGVSLPTCHRPRPASLAPRVGPRQREAVPSLPLVTGMARLNLVLVDAESVANAARLRPRRPTGAPVFFLAIAGTQSPTTSPLDRQGQYMVRYTTQFVSRLHRKLRPCG